MLHVLSNLPDANFAALSTTLPWPCIGQIHEDGHAFGMRRYAAALQIRYSEVAVLEREITLDRGHHIVELGQRQ